MGRRLLETLLRTGRERNLTGAALTTDRFAAFNMPFYASLGFRVPSDMERPAHLTDILAEEAENGLDPAHCVTMILAF